MKQKQKTLPGYDRVNSIERRNLPAASHIAMHSHYRATNLLGCLWRQVRGFGQCSVSVHGVEIKGNIKKASGKGSCQWF